MTREESMTLLKSVEVAQFVNQGFLRFDQLVDQESCDSILAEVKSGLHWQNASYGMAFRDVWPEASALRRGRP